MRDRAKDWDATVKALIDADELTVACHINPDGDALGSVLALTLGLRRLGKAVHPTWGQTPPKVPAQFASMPGADGFVSPADVPATPTFVALDCGAADRLGSLEKRAADARTLINIDHHRGNPEFGALNVVITDASSTAEVVAGLLRDAGVTLDRDIATCLWIGLVTDTGRFQYSNSSPSTLRLAADLVELDVPVAEIAHEVFESSPFDYLKLVGRVLERARLEERARFVHSWVTLVDMIETGVARDEMDTLIDLIRSTRAATVAALFKEEDDGTWRVSLRSRGPNVGEIARSYGGGGHDLAAGFNVPDRERAVGEITERLSA
ncbi:MAG: bifunctional oligoribonuclease/PAP phosphatase NrnA [Actinobacteria bacterium]|nr:bifunctional oligoribonuclease/PAP phosphatase NrnA [Actinomycetota bacterium]